MKKLRCCNDIRSLIFLNLKRMKITLVLIFLSVLGSYAGDIYSQTTKLNLECENKKITDILLEIEKQSEFRFFYNEEVNLHTKVSVNLSNAPIDKVLDMLLKNNNITYEVIGRQVILSPKGKQPEQKSTNVTGEVTNEKGESLPGVTIIVKGSSLGTITDTDGNFQLNNVPEDATLVFSFLGMKPLEVKVDGKSKVDVTLEEEFVNIDEVVAIGYGTMKKSDLTGSVASIKADDLNVFPSNNAMQALQGRASGVQIQSDNGGEPGGEFNVFIRGSSSINASSSPLLVVDGFPDGIMPQTEDIESVEILKDASSTAIYGSRGANGVILVTTKKGSKGDAKITFNASYSVQNETKRYDLLNASQFAEMMNTISDDTAFENPSLLGEGTDWQDQIFQTGNIQNYNLSISGGTDKVGYYL